MPQSRKEDCLNNTSILHFLHWNYIPFEWGKFNHRPLLLIWAVIDQRHLLLIWAVLGQRQLLLVVGCSRSKTLTFGVGCNRHSEEPAVHGYLDVTCVSSVLSCRTLCIYRMCMKKGLPAKQNWFISWIKRHRITNYIQYETKQETHRSYHSTKKLVQINTHIWVMLWNF